MYRKCYLICIGQMKVSVWKAFSLLPKSTGLKYTIGRVPMASCDFSTRVYSYDDVKGDFSLSHFALAKEDIDFKVTFSRINTHTNKPTDSLHQRGSIKSFRWQSTTASLLKSLVGAWLDEDNGQNAWRRYANWKATWKVLQNVGEVLCAVI